MKHGRLILPTLLLLSSCTCDLSIKTVASVTIVAPEKTRYVGEYFDVDHFSATLSYDNNSSKDVAFKKFSLNNLKASCTFPDGTDHAFTYDFLLEQVGTYILEVSYSPRSRDEFQCSDSFSFEVEEKIIKAESLTLESDSLVLGVDKVSQIKYSILPEDSTTKAPTFESNDPEVAMVDAEGNVTAIKEGQCIIKATADDIVKDVLVTVIPSNAVDYVFDSTKFTSQKGNWDYDIEGSSFDSKTNKGIYVAEKTEITSPTSLSNLSSIRIDGYLSRTLASSKDVGFTFLFYIDDVKFDSYICTSEDHFSIILDVENKSGFLKIVTDKVDGIKLYLRSISVDFNVPNVYPTSIALNGNNSLAIGESNKLTVSYTPQEANIREITWSSSNEDILVIGRDGTFTGVEQGSAIVTAKIKTQDGYTTANFEIEVTKVDVESVNLDVKTLEIDVKKSKKLTASVLPNNASHKEVTFESSNPNIATVDASGNVTGISIGECTITCRSRDNLTAYDTCQINVIAPRELTSNEMSLTIRDYYKKNIHATDCSPSIGDVKLLVIPIWFTDSSTYISLKENVRSDIEKVYFGTSEETGWQSVKSYYEQESNGKLTLTGTVSEWYEASQKMSDFSYDTNGRTTSSLVKKATNWYFNNHTSDSRANYDSDHNGFIDGVILIYGAPDYSAFEAQASIYSRTSYGDNLWAYTYWLQDSSLNSVSSPGPNVFFWASYDFMYGSANAKNRTGKSSYNSGKSSHLSIDAHTFIHEMGHVFGLEDYYDYSGAYIPAGGFSMQDYNVGGHDPFSCLALGWASAFIPEESCEIKLKPFQDSHQVILLSPSFNSYNSPFDEYLLLELYTPTGLNKFDTDYEYTYGYPRGVNATGIRLWHVDARLVTVDAFGKPSTKTYNNVVNNCKIMTSNTYYSSESVDYISICGRKYADYNMLQLLKNSTTATYKPTDYFKESYLFKNGSFDMNTYRRQFVNSGLLNSNAKLGWNFSVSISGSSSEPTATITLNKE